ncbi:Rep family protein [Ligilactobacillus salivarius]|uniref:Rep family protein n=1 Tax=Ligilactobacillus salivarius TaxID=1624 RepID=UPI0025A37C7D|nr:Rep family protein [Ligilactobacillus salivarius]MDM8284882.1 Rep family protein [Ligilactobacillus salivarius]
MEVKKTQSAEEVSKVSPRRSPVLMLVQQEEHLSLPINELQTKIERLKNIGLIRWAYIKHDKDKDEDGKLVAPHYHFTLQFKKRVSVNSIAKRLKENVNRFEIMTKRGLNAKVSANNAFAYLVHRTENAREKYQYDPKDVVSNFDFPKFIQELSEQMTPQDVLDMLGEGKITKREAQRQILALGASIMSKYKRKIDDVYTTRLDLEYHKWVKEMKAANEPIKVIWCYGAGGTGKTRYAREWAIKQNLNYYICSGSNSPFDGLKNLSAQEQEVLIIDELRPETVKYPDLLQILDPMNFEKVAVARYHNPHIMAKIIFVCTIYDPYQFYRHMPRLDRNIDTFDQLSRRIGLNIEFTKYYIKETVPKLSKVKDKDTGNPKTTYMYKTTKSYKNKFKKNKVETRFTLEDLENYRNNN